MLWKKLCAILTALCSVLLAGTPLAGLLPHGTEIAHRYIIIQDTDSEKSLDLLRSLYGENDPENEVLYAMGVCGPMLLTDAPEVIARKTENAFRLAVEYNIPVWFQIDDVNNHNYAYMGETAITCEKWYDVPENCEKLGFGEDAPLAPYWFCWGNWQTTPATPCFNSASFVRFIRSQLEDGFLPVLEKWLHTLREADKEYLFAGVSVGWETRIPDYSNIPAGTADQYGRVITDAERTMTGFRALENLGYTQEKLDAEAKARHISAARLRFELLAGVVHDYSEMITKEIAGVGVEKTKIFTHFVIDTELFHTDRELDYNASFVSSAVNDYSTPGFTNNSNTSFRRLGTLKAKIAAADPAQPYFGIVEGYAAGLNENKKDTLRYFDRLFDSGALVVAVYGIHDTEPSPYVVPKTADAPFTQAVRELLRSSASEF